MKIKILILAILIYPVFLLSQTSQADVFPAGGGHSENTQYKNFGTFGQPSAGKSVNTSYKNNEGFLYSQDSPVCINPSDGGEIEAAQTICYDTAPVEITNKTTPTGHLGDLEYKWQFTTLDPDGVDFEDSDWEDIEEADEDSYQPEDLTETTWYRRLVKVDCESDWLESNVIEVTVVQPTVYVSDDYDNLTTGWGETHFDDLDFVLGLECANLTVILSNYEHTGDLDITGYTFKVGEGIFHLNGSLSGGLIETTDDGIFTQTAVNNTARTFPITDGDNDFTVTITPSSTNGNIGVRLNKAKEVTGALSNPMTFFDIYGNNGLSGTVKLRIDKSAIGNNPIPSNFLMRFWNGTRYVPIPQSKVTVTDKGDYYEITITQFTYFNQTT